MPKSIKIRTKLGFCDRQNFFLLKNHIKLPKTYIKAASLFNYNDFQVGISQLCYNICEIVFF